jgi:hypothetical protein
MSDKYYILDDAGNPVPCDDLQQWAQWYETANAKRIVAQDDVADGVKVSTVFLGLDHNYGEGPPLLYTATAADDDAEAQAQADALADGEAMRDEQARDAQRRL